MGTLGLKEIVVLLTLKGGPEYAARMDEAALSTDRFTGSLLRTSAAMKTSTERSFLHNQALFTARRYAFYATLAISGLAYEVFRLGMSYNSTIQTAKVALRGMFPDTATMDNVISRLYKLSTFSPFLFKDTLTAFRTMAPAMKNAGISVNTTLETMKAVMDALSESGRTNIGSLTRVSIQLQHLANIGKPTGQVLIALARDGLPVYPALRKELGLTGNSLSTLSTSGLTALQTIQALNKFIESSPVYQGQAFKQATQTLQGNWQMFKDILAQAAGTATGGLFGGLTDRMRAVNDYLRKPLMQGKSVGLTQIAQALNKAFTPGSNVIINFFVTLTTAIQTLLFVFGLFAKAIGFVAKLLDWLPSKLGANNVAAKLFGGTLGVLAAVFLLARVALFPFILAIDLWKAVVKTAEAVAAIWRVTMLVLNGEWAAAWALVTGNTEATAANTAVVDANAGAIDVRTGMFVAANTETGNAIVLQDAYNAAIIEGSIAQTQYITTIEGATVAARGFGLAIMSWLGPLALAATAIYLVIKYQKQINAGFASVAKHLGATAKSSAGPQPGPLQFLEHPIRYFFYSPALHDIEHHQFGGVSRGGLAMVGEAGPELLSLPRGAAVTPLTGAAGGLSITVIPQDIYIDSKKIATVLADVVTGKEARMSGRQ